MYISNGVLEAGDHYAGVGRRNESCRHKWLLLGALNGHFEIFTLQIFRFCRHMWRCDDHLPTPAMSILNAVYNHHS